MKGDASDFKSQLGSDRGMLQNQMNRLSGNMGPQTTQMQSNYNQALGQNQQNFNDIMNQYNRALYGGLTDASGKQTQQGINTFNLNPADRANVERALGGYTQFAQTGGFSPQDIQNIRARSVDPTRAAYANAQSEVSRQNALAGGNMANFAPAMARMARQQGASVADANTNANAAIAQMVQQGKLAGLAGETSTAQNLMGQQLSADTLRNQMMLQGIAGQSGLYGTAPGMTSVLGNQMLGQQGQNIDVQNLQNQLSLGLLGRQLQGTQIPSNFSQGLGNIGGILGLLGQFGQFAGAFSPQYDPHANDNPGGAPDPAGGGLGSPGGTGDQL